MTKLFVLMVLFSLNAHAFQSRTYKCSWSATGGIWPNDEMDLGSSGELSIYKKNGKYELNYEVFTLESLDFLYFNLTSPSTTREGVRFITLAAPTSDDWLYFYSITVPSVFITGTTAQAMDGKISLRTLVNKEEYAGSARCNLEKEI